MWDDTDDTLVFVDIVDQLVHRFDPATGDDTSWSTPSTIGAVGLCSDGGFVLALVDGFALCGPGGEDLRPIPGFRTDRSVVRFNDGMVDPWGGFVAGTMDWKYVEPLGSLYRLDPHGQVDVLFRGCTISNGLCWSANRRRFYYVDTPTQRIDVFDADPESGALSGRRALVEIDKSVHGRPDGMTIDVDGCLWVACYDGGRVLRVTPRGVIDAVVDVPTSCASSVTWGGSALDQLYITTGRVDLTPEQLASEPHAGDLFVVEPGTSGMPADRYSRPVGT